MKKLVSLMLSLTMIISLTTCGFAAAGDGSSRFFAIDDLFTAKEPPTMAAINSDERYTNNIVTTTKSVVEGLYSLVSKAKKASSVKESDAKAIAKLGFDPYTMDGELYGEWYTVYKAEGEFSDLLYIKRNNNRLYQIDAEAFYRFADESSAKLYKFRTIPTAKVDSNTELYISASEYQFRKLDGLFYKTSFVAGECGVELNDNAAIPTPEFSVKPKSVKVSVLFGSKTVWSGNLSEVNKFKAEQSGSHSVKYTATFDNTYYKGDVVYSYMVKYSPRPTGIKFLVEGNVTAPGELVFLKALNIPEGGKVTVKSDIQFTPHFFRQSNGDMVALFPVSWYNAPGQHYIELSCNGVSQKFTLDTKSKKFVEQYLTVPASTADATINSQKANDEFEKNIAPIRYVSDNKQYWSGRFIWPLKNLPRRTTEFGTIRYTNGDMKNPSRHGAIDFAAAAGTPVYAPANGRVLYSGFLQLTGNTICIEHGYGLKTWYYHMNGRNVKTDDMVKQGQQIGIVGSTGFSTGAHLHYGMSVSNTTSGNVWINPDTAVNTDLFATFPS